MKVIRFLIYSQIFISTAGVSLALATQTQIGALPGFYAYQLVIFFATLFEYNLHSYLKFKNDPDALITKKNTWVVNNTSLVKLLIILSLTGLTVSLFFVSLLVIFLFIALSLPTLLYSIVITRQSIRWQIKEIPGLKIFLIAFTWSAVTVFVPLLQAGIAVNRSDVILLFAERFTFIFAIAIPFDIRDMKQDILSGLMTIPVAFGIKRALLIADFALAVSLSIAAIHYTLNNTAYILPAYIASVVLSFIFINSKKLRRLPLYYHGILDGSIILHGILLSISFYLNP